MTRSIADLYLAYRQAKSALYSERRSVGLWNIAAYEADLETNLRQLCAKLRSASSWFDDLDVGSVLVAPKSLHLSKTDETFVEQVGNNSNGQAPVDLSCRLVLLPSVEFAIAEVLYLWLFGPAIESVLSSDVLGYRLKLYGGCSDREARSLFEYWPKQYERFRSQPLQVATSCLSRLGGCLVTSFDFTSFYDSIDPSFLVDVDFIRRVERDSGAAGRPFDAKAFELASRSLLSAYSRFYSKCSGICGFPVTRGVPIGSLTSRVVANLALEPVDTHIRAAKAVLCYRRYVDDLIVIAEPLADADIETATVLKQWLPFLSGQKGLQLDSAALGRPGSSLAIQPAKTSAYQLTGSEGGDFLKAVISDQQQVVSESRSLLDTAMIDADNLAALARVGSSQRSRLRVLREKDRKRLASMELGTALTFLERVAEFVDVEEARRVVSSSLAPLLRLLPGSRDWMTTADLVVRLIRVSLLAQDWKSTQGLLAIAEAIWGDSARLRRRVKNFFWNDRALTQGSTLDALLEYFQLRAAEVVCSAMFRPQLNAAGQFQPQISIPVGPQRLDYAQLRLLADDFAAADLRRLDREDEARRGNAPAPPRTYSSLEKELEQDPALQTRFLVIHRFVALCKKLEDRAWIGAPLSLYLLLRPPRYFDVARRMFSHGEHVAMSGDVFTDILEFVNALRGTKYWHPVGEVLESGNIRLSSPPADYPEGLLDARIILGNLAVENEWFAGAATKVAGSSDGQPVLSCERLDRLSHVLDRARFVAGRRHASNSELPTSVLVLPELSVPRRWARLVALHIVRTNKHSAVMGLEYAHLENKPFVFNQVWGVFPGPFRSVAAFVWTKNRPARIEEHHLAKDHGVRFRPMGVRGRAVLDTPIGRMSVLICSELIEPLLISRLFGATELILAPAWNKDTTSYDQLIRAVGIQTHSIIAVANNGIYSDCRVWAPYGDRWKRDRCRLVQRNADTVVWVDVPTAQLRRIHERGSVPPSTGTTAIQGGKPEPEDEWMPLPPGWTSTGEE